MKIYGITTDQAELALAKANELYDDNLCWKAPPSKAGSRKPHVYCLLRVFDSRGPGAYIASRRTVAACWHAHRDFMRRISELNPHAEIRTFVTYRGRNDFEERHTSAGDPWTQYAGRASYMSENCECEAGS